MKESYIKGSCMKKKTGIGRRRLLGLLVMIGLVLGYGFGVEPNLLVVRQYTLQSTAPTGHETIRLAQISDLQIGRAYTIYDLERVVRRLEQLKPDVVLFHGDLFENYSQCGAQQEKAVTDLLKRLEAPLGCYAVWGNRDYGGGAEKAYRRILQAAGFTLLCNESAELTTAGGQRLLLCGLDDSLFGQPDGQAFWQQAAQPYAYRILMLHEPDVAQLWSHSEFQLILAGHSHGGQVRLPFGGGETTTLARQYVRHFYTLNAERGLLLYVNTGLGTSHLPVRFGVPPEIALFTIQL